MRRRPASRSMSPQRTASTEQGDLIERLPRQGLRSLVLDGSRAGYPSQGFRLFDRQMDVNGDLSDGFLEHLRRLKLHDRFAAAEDPSVPSVAVGNHGGRGVMNVLPSVPVLVRLSPADADGPPRPVERILE